MVSLDQFDSLNQFFGSCCYLLCFNDAVYYDAEGRGYCLSHAPKHVVEDDE